MESVFVLLWSCINKPMLQLHVGSKSCQNGRRLHPYPFVWKQKWWSFIFISYQNMEILSSLISSPLSSQYSQKTLLPIASDVSSSAGTFCASHCTCAEWHNSFFSKKIVFYQHSYQKLKRVMKSDAAPAGAKQTNATAHKTGGQSSAFSALLGTVTLYLHTKTCHSLRSYLYPKQQNSIDVGLSCSE